MVLKLKMLLIVILIVYVFKKKDFILSLISFTFILVSVFAIIGSLYDNHIGGRYTVLSGIILIFFVLRVYLIEEKKFLKDFSMLCFSLYLDKWVSKIIIGENRLFFIAGSSPFKISTSCPSTSW